MRKAARCMEWTLHYLPRKAVLLARTDGVYEPEAARIFVQALGLGYQQHSPKVLMIDRRRSELKLSTMNIYAHPTAYGQAGIAPPAIIAVVVAAITADEQFLETVFRNQGYQMKTFCDWRRAVAWVLGSRRLV